MAWVELNLIAISACESSPEHYVLVFEAESSFRRLAVIIGKWEAQAIAVALERVQPSRPMTHDLMARLLQHLRTRLVRVEIYRVEDKVFYSHLVIQQGEEVVRVDARTSDAVALAVRVGCPVYADEAVMAAAGHTLDAPERAFSAGSKPYEAYSISELERLLELFIEKEDFRAAAHIHEILKRKRQEEE